MDEGWGAPELWKKARDGDADAFSRLVGVLVPRLRPFLYRVSGFREEVDDLCQEVLVRLVQGLPRLADPSKGRSFVLGIATRARQERSRRRRSVGEVPELPTRDASPFDRAVGRELEERARAALAELPESLREVLVLVVHEQLEPTQVAAVLGLSPGAVRHRLFRARRAMREALEPSGTRELDAERPQRTGGRP